MEKIIFATGNINKLQEAKSILKDLPYKFVGLNNYPDIPPIEETGTSLLENSLIKARTVFDITGLPSIGDDTGLEVECLNGAPGVFSGRYAGENATYDDNLNKILHEISVFDAIIIEQNYTDQIEFIIEVPIKKVLKFRESLTNISSGSVKFISKPNISNS